MACHTLGLLTKSVSMAHTDRLMRLMDALRRLPAPVTAARLASETDVSRRQLYRDIATLRAGGALIDGEAGVGYTLTEDPALPPQSFSRLEIEALVLAVGDLHQTGDADLQAAGRSALARIIATLPDGQSRQALHTVLRSFHAPSAAAPPRRRHGVAAACLLGGTGAGRPLSRPRRASHGARNLAPRHQLFGGQVETAGLVLPAAGLAHFLRHGHRTQLPQRGQLPTAPGALVARLRKAAVIVGKTAVKPSLSNSVVPL